MYKILVNFSLSLESKPGTGKQTNCTESVAPGRKYLGRCYAFPKPFYWDKRFHLNSPGITRFSVQMVSSPVVRVSDSDDRR